MSSDSTSLNAMEQGTMPSNETDPPAQNEQYTMPYTETNPPAATSAFALPLPDIDLHTDPPIPPAQTSAAYDDMENAIKETVDDAMGIDAPIPPAQIANQYDIIQNAMKTSIEDNENGVDAPLPPSTAADGLDDDEENQNQKLGARTGANENDDAAQMAPATPTSGNRGEATALPVNQRSSNEQPSSSTHPINNPQRPTSFWRRSQRQRQQVRIPSQPQQSAPPEVTIPPSLPPPTLGATSPTNNNEENPPPNDEENPPVPVLEATLVVESPPVPNVEATLILPNNIPIYDATPITSTHSPRWKRYRNGFVITLFLGMATIIMLPLINGNNGNEVDTQPVEQFPISTTPPTSMLNSTVQSPVLPPSNPPTNETTAAPATAITLAPAIRPISFPVTTPPTLPPTNRPTTNEPTSKPTLEPTTETPTPEPMPKPTPKPSNSPINGSTAAPKLATMEQLQSSALELVLSEAIVSHLASENVAMYGDTLIVGVPYNNNKRGFALVYIRDDKGKWSQRAKLEAPDGADGDRFGWSVAIHGNTVIVGAFWDVNNGTNSGSVDVFVGNGGTWMHQAKLLAADGAAGDYFGYSIGIFGDTVIIGAPYDSGRGSAHLFVRKNGIWTHQAKLTVPDGSDGNNFGLSLGIFNDTVIVGAPRDDENGSDSGSVHLFALNQGIWTHQARLFAPDGAAYLYFGWSVGIFGDTVIVGAPNDVENGLCSGSAHVFALDNNIWTHQAKIVAPDGAARHFLGQSVGVYMDTVVVGSELDDDNGANSGSLYLFTRIEGAWDYHAKLLAPNTGQRFGQSVVTYNGTVVAGSEGGEVYVFSSDSD